MATRYGDSSNRSYGFSPSVNRKKSSDDDYPPNSSNYYKQTKKDSYDQQDSTDLDDMTLTVVNDFKRIVQNKIQDGAQMRELIIELDVANIRRNKYPEQCNFDQWKRDLPRDVQNCPDAILRVSMAYGNDPQEVKPILQAKMNNINSNVNPTDTSLHNIIDPLKKLKRELDNNRQPNLFHAVLNIDDHDPNRANRLFISEAHHFAPGLKDYTFADAQNAVRAIRQTKYESDDQKSLILIIKTLRDYDEICETLENLSTKHNESPTKPSRSFDDDPRITSNSTNNSPNHNNNDPTSSFYYKPLHNPYQNSSQSSGRSAQSDNRSKDESTRGPPRRDSDKK